MQRALGKLGFERPVSEGLLPSRRGDLGASQHATPLDWPGRSLALRAKGRIAYPPAGPATFLHQVSETAQSSRPALLIEMVFGPQEAYGVEDKRGEREAEHGRHLRDCLWRSVCDPRRQVENGGDLLRVMVDVEARVTGQPVRH